MTNGAPPQGYPAGSQQIVRISETDATKLSKSASTTIAYVAQQQAQELLYASSTQIDAPDGAQSSASVTKYASPRIVARSAGASWSNSPARTIDEDFSDGHREDRAVAADGTYVEDGTALAYYGQLVKTRLSDTRSGAGSYMGPFLGCPPGTRFSFSAPSGTPSQIFIALKSAATGCTLPAQSFSAWFEPAPKFYAESDKSARTRVPSACGQAKGRRATNVRSLITVLDTIIGYVELTQSDAYSTSEGLQCVRYLDTMLVYYDWQGDTPYALLLPKSAKPIAKVVTEETLVAGSRGATLPPAVAAGALERHFAASLLPQRERLRSAMITRLTHVTGGLR